MLGCNYGLTGHHRDQTLGENFRRGLDWLSPCFGSHHDEDFQELFGSEKSTHEIAGDYLPAGSKR